MNVTGMRASARIGVGAAFLLASSFPLLLSNGDAAADTTSEQTQTVRAESVSMPGGATASDVAPSDERITIRRRPVVASTDPARLEALPDGGTTDVTVVPEGRSAHSRTFVTQCFANGGNTTKPSGSHGAIGPRRIVAVTRRDRVGVYRRDCQTVSLVSLNKFFRNVRPRGEILLDPRVVFDPDSQRFFLTVQSQNRTNTDQAQYFAVSQDATARRWWVFRILLSSVADGIVFCKSAADSVWQDPSAGVNKNRWFVTANDTAGGAILSIEKAPTLDGNEATVKCFKNLDNNIAPPIVLDAADAAFFLSPGSGGGNEIRRYRLNTAGGTAADDTIVRGLASIPVNTWRAPPRAEQPNGEKIQTSDGRFQSASIQVGAVIWNVHTVKIGQFARWRLYKMQTSGGAPLFTFNPTTDTCQSCDHLFAASMSTSSDALGTKAFVSCTRTMPSIAGDIGNPAFLMFNGPNHTPDRWEFDVIDEAATGYTGCGAGCPWGPASATQFDPIAPGRGWGFNQSVSGNTADLWRMSIGAVR